MRDAFESLNIVLNRFDDVIGARIIVHFSLVCSYIMSRERRGMMSDGKIQLEVGYILQCMDIEMEKWQTLRSEQDDQQARIVDVHYDNDDT